MDWVTLALSVGGKLLDKLPDYPEKQKKDFFEKTELYNIEKVRDPNDPKRDDDLILFLRESLKAHLILIEKKAK